MRKKIISVVGARPQFIKAAGLSLGLRKLFNEVLVHTGQHYDYEMSQVFFSGLKIPKPDYNLSVGSDTHARQTAKIMIGLERVIIKEKPDALLVYGDTNSTLAGPLVAAKMHIPSFHVEAGMRSFDRNMPEEINRIVADHLCQLFFCATEASVENLREEGVTRNIYLVGNLMEEVLIRILPKAKAAQERLFKKLDIKQKRYIYTTIHRASNTDSKKILTDIVKTLLGIDRIIIFPVHPRTQKMFKQYCLWNTLKKSTNIKLIEPVNYLESIALQEGAKYIITDSGGIQREAYRLQVPCITLRSSTEWPETVSSGWNRLVDPTKSGITNKIHLIPRGRKIRYETIHTSSKIVRQINNFFIRRSK